MPHTRVHNLNISLDGYTAGALRRCTPLPRKSGSGTVSLRWS